MSATRSHDLRTETASRLGQIRDLERELVELHGYRRAPHPAGALECVDPANGQRMTLGAVVARLRREHREGREVLARDEAGERGEGEEQGAEGVHAAAVRRDGSRGELGVK